MRDSPQTSHETLLAILNSLDAVVYVADIQTHELLFLNRYAQSIFGDGVGKPCWQVLQSNQTAPCDFCSNDKLLSESGEITGPYAWEFQNTANSRWYDIRDRAIKWIDGRTVRLEIATDITDRKQAENQLRASEKRYNALFTGITDGVLVHHIAGDESPGQIIDANHVVCKMLGYRRDELIGMSIGDIDAPESVVDVRHIAKDLKAGRDVLFEQMHLAKNGARIPVEVHAQTFEYEDRLVIMSTVRDITERKLAEKALQQAHDELEQRVAERTEELGRVNAELQKDITRRKQIEEELLTAKQAAEVANIAKGSFLTSISHELRTPLHSIIGFSELLHDRFYGPLTENQKEYVSAIIDSGKHLN